MIHSDIARICDRSVAIAATQVQGIADLNKGTMGIRAIFAAGTGEIADPLNPGQFVAQIPSNVIAPLTLVCLAPSAPSVGPDSQSHIKYEWQIPHRLYLDMNLRDAMHAIAMRFEAALVGAYLYDRTMAGLCDQVWISSIGPVSGPEDQTWAALPYVLTVVERIAIP